MTFRNFIKDRALTLWVAVITVAFSAFFLHVFRFPLGGTLLFVGIIWGGLLVSLLLEFHKRKRFYDDLMTSLETLRERYHIAEIVPEASFLEAHLLKDIMAQVGKSMNDALAMERRANREYREYIELWVHEIKTPIAALKLLSENKGDMAVNEEVDKVEKYVEQALYYARAGAVEKDLIIKPTPLRALIGETLKRQARYLISRGISISLEGFDQPINQEDVESTALVYADAKWLGFILQQLIDNAIKYQAHKIYFLYQEESRQLQIRDDGVGILAADLGRIFERGFTGENGRKFAKATGMGLYICQELCQKMGIVIGASSVYGEGTTISLTFPEKSLHELT